jgi:protein-L-isoaspartate(D-aspartate) O-methyltransferase
MQTQTQTNNETARFNMQSATARFNMIEQQIRPWDVLDPVVLKLLNDLPRENFVPADYQGLAFADLEIPIGADIERGQTMLSPKLEGRMLQSLDVQNHHKVLHVGLGSGYFTALLASLAHNVLAIEIYETLLKNALKSLVNHGISNVTTQLGDGAKGWAANAPYDRIVFTASSPVEPAGVRQQLAVGGKLLIILGHAPAMQAVLIERMNEAAFREDVLFETCLPALSNAEKSQTFEF